MKIFPSLICADLLSLKDELRRYDPYVDGYHLDIMDFHFVHNLTWGPEFVNALRVATKKPFMVHLMVQHPERYFDHLSLHEGDIVSVHAESSSYVSLPGLFEACSSRGWQAGLALNPETPLSLLYEVEMLPDHLLVMSVNPGFSGQSFIPSTYYKLAQAVAYRKEKGHPYTIALDGGITLSQAPHLKELGADQIAVGSALFASPDPIKALVEFRELFSRSL